MYVVPDDDREPPRSTSNSANVDPSRTYRENSEVDDEVLASPEDQLAQLSALRARFEWLRRRSSIVDIDLPSDSPYL